MFAFEAPAATGLISTVARRAMLALLAPALALAGGCASYLGAQVTSFHQLTPQHTLDGRRFAIEPSSEQRDSLEFQAYADLVRQALVRNGLVDAAGGNAELAVSIRYSIDNGKAVSYGYPAYGYANYGPVWGWAPYRTPGGGVNYVWTPTYPVSYGVIGTNYANTMLYRRELKVEITGASSGPAPGRLYEGTVVSEGESASLAPVMPAMVRALFHDFPGVNGASRVVQVTLDPEGEPARRGPGSPAGGQ